MASSASSRKDKLIKREHARLRREYNAKVKQAGALLKPILGEAFNYVVLHPNEPHRPATHYEVQLNRDCEITFAMQAISEAFNTKLINLRHEAGWEGTEETGGDPDKLCLTIAVS